MRVYMLLDRSGSMSTMMREAIPAINGYVGKLTGDTHVTLASFDSDSYDIVRDSTVKGWKDIRVEEVQPRGMTPLYDSAGKLLTRAFEDNPEKAYIVIMTDGDENCSREYTQASIKAKLAEAEKKNWEVIFLGANFDTRHQAAGFGVSFDKSINYTVGNMAAEFTNLASSTVAYACAGTRTVFTDADRARASKSN